MFIAELCFLFLFVLCMLKINEGVSVVSEAC